LAERLEDYDIRPPDLILADPPYNQNHLKYGTAPVHKIKVIKACAKILKIGGFLVWLDTIQPIWSKADGWKLRGTIGFLQSTNHAVRVISMLEKIQ
jgi:16S rRNA G966 N2-methylase RsmD